MMSLADGLKSKSFRTCLLECRAPVPVYIGDIRYLMPEQGKSTMLNDKRAFGRTPV